MQSKDDLDSYKIILEKTVQSHLTRNGRRWVYFWKEGFGKLRKNVTQLSNPSFLFVKKRYFLKERYLFRPATFKLLEDN